MQHVKRSAVDDGLLVCGCSGSSFTLNKDFKIRIEAKVSSFRLKKAAGYIDLGSFFATKFQMTVACFFVQIVSLRSIVKYVAKYAVLWGRLPINKGGTL